MLVAAGVVDIVIDPSDHELKPIVGCCTGAVTVSRFLVSVFVSLPSWLT